MELILNVKARDQTKCDWFAQAQHIQPERGRTECGKLIAISTPSSGYWDIYLVKATSLKDLA